MHKLWVLVRTTLFSVSNAYPQCILCTINEAFSDVQLTLVLYRKIPVAMTRIGFKANETTNLKTLSFK